MLLLDIFSFTLMENQLFGLTNQSISKGIWENMREYGDSDIGDNVKYI